MLSTMAERGSLFIPPKTYLEKNEQKTIDFLLNHGKNIKVLKPVNKPFKKTADIEMCGLVWEIKNPTGKGKRTIVNNFATALGQSQNIIFDLRNCKRNKLKAKNEVVRQYKIKHKCKRLIIINNDKEYLCFSK